MSNNVYLPQGSHERRTEDTSARTWAREWLPVLQSIPRGERARWKSHGWAVISPEHRLFCSMVTGRWIIRMRTNHRRIVAQGYGPESLHHHLRAAYRPAGSMFEPWGGLLQRRSNWDDFFSA